MRVSILNAGGPTDYLYGLASGLSGIDSLHIDVVDGEASVGVLDTLPSVTLYNLRGDNLSRQSLTVKIFRILRYYSRLLWYAATTDAQLFHIQWDNSLFLFDRTLLLMYYKLLGKKLVYTAHNVDKEDRDDRSNVLNRFYLRAGYHLVDAIIVHTQRMKDELSVRFGVRPEMITVIPHGLNIRTPRTGVSKATARAYLGIDTASKVVLAFGLIDRYKGIELAIQAVTLLARSDRSVLLIVAGNPKRKSEYVETLKTLAEPLRATLQIRFDLRFVPVGEVESYFVSADCVILPYRKIFQSGILFLAYRFGIPVVATDVGNFREDIIENETGFVCKPDDAVAMAETLSKFFSSDLYASSETARQRVMAYAEEKYSWDHVARSTVRLYERLIGVH